MPAEGNNGACVFTGTSGGFCATNGANVANGRGAVTEYPQGETVVDKATGLMSVVPSEQPGVRSGIAPPGVFSVTVSAAGKEYSSAKVERGLYALPVPAEAVPTEIQHLDASGARVDTTK